MRANDTDFMVFNTNSSIFDLGSGTIKAGISGEEKPSCEFESIIGYPKFNQILPMNIEHQIVGPDKEIRGLYRLERAIKRGVLENEGHARQIINKIYNDLKLMSNKDIPVFIAEPPFTSKK